MRAPGPRGGTLSWPLGWSDAADWHSRAGHACLLCTFQSGEKPGLWAGGSAFSLTEPCFLSAALDSSATETLFPPLPALPSVFPIPHTRTPGRLRTTFRPSLLTSQWCSGPDPSQLLRGSRVKFAAAEHLASWPPAEGGSLKRSSSNTVSQSAMSGSLQPHGL